MSASRRACFHYRFGVLLPPRARKPNDAYYFGQPIVAGGVTVSNSIARLNAALEGRYRVERELGEGGMAVVYLADDLRHRRKVALKVLKPGLAEAMEAERFLSEISTTANLQHPHILPLFDSGEADGFLFYVMPYFEGESLREMLARERQLPVDEALRIATGVAEALAYAHGRGVIHRDIKPGNILIQHGQAVVTDFGIALALDAAEGRLTDSRFSLGTPSYSSPEQVQAPDSVDGRADIYSLACVLHEMLAGEPVFTGSLGPVIVAKHLEATPPPIRSLRSAVPVEVERAILRGLEKSPADRFASMGEFAAALNKGARSPDDAAPFIRALRARPVLMAGLATVVLVASAVLTMQMSARPAWADRPESLVVLAFSDAASTPEEATLAAQLAEVAAREINRWDPVRAVPSVDLAGPRQDLGMGTSSLERVDQGLALARAVDAQALLALTVRIQGDSTSIEAQLYESRTARRVDGPFFNSGVARSAADMVAPIVAEVLGFGDAAEPTRALQAGTSDPDAAREYLSGLEELSRNRLEVAEARFRRAIDIDPTFASAHSSLGQTLFWQWVQGDGSPDEPGPEIVLRSTVAMDHLGGLSDRNRLSVRAFYAFQLGDYDQARALYRSVRDSDPNDLLALTMIGEIEVHDPWLASAAGEPPRPRSDLGLALDSFLEAVTLLPSFELAYGRLFTIQASLEAAPATCPVFDEIRDQLVSPWAHITPSESAAVFCPAVQDSFTWMSRSEYGAADPRSLRQGADRLLARFVRAFERWASFAPQQPRALEQLSDVRLLQRRRAGTAAPERLRQLGEEALDYLSRSLALRADTTAEQLIRLANLHLTAGQYARGIELAREVSNRYTTQDLGGLGAAPARLANPLVAGGETSYALTVASGVAIQRFVRSPSTSQMIPYGGAEPILEKIRVLGSMGVGGPPLRTELDRLRGAWSIAGYSAGDQQLLRNTVTPSLAPALLADSVALRSWLPSVDVDRPFWQAVAALSEEPIRAGELYVRAVADESDGLRPATRAFVLGRISAALGLHTEAISHYSLLDSIPHGVDSFDPGWGLEVLSHALRAEHYESLGQLDEAMAQLTHFIEARSESDSLSVPALQEARRDAARIQGALRRIR